MFELAPISQLLFNSGDDFLSLRVHKIDSFEVIQKVLVGLLQFLLSFNAAGNALIDLLLFCERESFHLEELLE
jgi:hypothetical protein